MKSYHNSASTGVWAYERACMCAGVRCVYELQFAFSGARSLHPLPLRGGRRHGLVQFILCRKRVVQVRDSLR